MSWTIDGIGADDLITPGVPTFERGREVSLEFIIQSGDVTEQVTTEVLGGTGGTTLGGTEPGSLGPASLGDAETNHRNLMDYIEVNGTVTHGRTNDGEVYVREYLDDAAPVDSLIVPIDKDVTDSRMPSVWVAIKGGTDTTRVHGFLAIQFDVVILALLEEYPDRATLKNDLGTTLTQL